MGFGFGFAFVAAAVVFDGAGAFLFKLAFVVALDDFWLDGLFFFVESDFLSAAFLAIGSGFLVGVDFFTAVVLFFVGVGVFFAAVVVFLAGAFLGGSF